LRARSGENGDDPAATSSLSVPPLVLHVRPRTKAPGPAPVRPMQAVVLGLVGLFGGLALILLYLGGGAGGDGATALAGILLVPASLCLVVYVVALMATKPLPRTWSAEHFVEIPTGGTSSDDFAQFASEWRKITRGPDSKTIRQIIGVAPSPGALQARILCIGAIEVPEIGDFRFEPVIISPTQYFWRFLRPGLCAT
jgi:hypothetical protein